jgi:hypothetical protein
MEPQTNYYAYPHSTGMRQPFPKSFECHACPTIYVLFGKSANDVSTYEKYIRWPGPWFLPESRPVAKLFLATWCQSNSRPLFPRLSPKPKLPFLVTLHLPYLTRLLNDPICHDPHWLPMPTKLPLDTPKFEAKPNEDPGDHVTTFHLWCSSNSLKYDSVQLRLFQHTLIWSATKWYIGLDPSRYSSFGELAMAFLNHFQLPVRYDAGTELLANFEQMTIDHISDHI